MFALTTKLANSSRIYRAGVLDISNSNRAYFSISSIELELEYMLILDRGSNELLKTKAEKMRGKLSNSCT